MRESCIRHAFQGIFATWQHSVKPGYVTYGTWRRTAFRILESLLCPCSFVSKVRVVFEVSKIPPPLCFVFELAFSPALPVP